MRLRTLLADGALGLRLLHGAGGLDAPVRGVMTTDLRDPSRYLRGGELVLTGLAWWRGPADSEPFVRILARAGVAGLAAGEAELGAVPDDLAAACARHGLPLFAVAQEVAFAEITERVVRQISGHRAGDLAAVVDRHRRLMSAGPGGGGPQAVLDLLGADLDLPAWLLSATGRVVAGTARAALPAPVAARLAAHAMTAAASGRPGPYRVPPGTEAGGEDGNGDGDGYALFPVPGDGDDPHTAALTGWQLAVRADPRDWPAERLDLMAGVAQLIAADRDRREASRTVQRRLAREILRLLRERAAPAEVAARLRVAGPLLVPGLTEPRWQLVVARIEGPAAAADGGGRVAEALLEELLAAPGTVEGALVAGAADGEAVALVPLPAVPGEGAALRAATVLAPVRTVLAAGLGPNGRLTLGMSAPVAAAGGLRGALEEARHARRVAAARTGPVCGAGHDELASHVLLLPFVPEEVRLAFTARLLDPLRAYDRRHRSELIPTLEAYLEADGSWTRCAARLHLHVNTLRYRVGRIEALTGRDLTRLEDKLDFFLALRLSR
ncbi:PucR family transcriptional regulator ligand-binding domain-containing protein [Streptomyces harbinensis]|uniref:PucR family transcriptional regulator n=1 Tax=Streptomyces harbinensis TaxID=1176198 RepID=UPI003394C685